MVSTTPISMMPSCTAATGAASRGPRRRAPRAFDGIGSGEAWDWGSPPDSTADGYYNGPRRGLPSHKARPAVSSPGVELQYRDFEIQILPGEGVGYQVRARCEEAEADGTLTIPAELATASWETACSHARDLGSFQPTSPALTTREIGDLLFQALFTKGILDLLNLSDSRKDSGLRFRLRIDRRLSEVLILPWELLYVAATGDFLGLSRRTPIVRALDVLRPVPPASPAPRLRILGIASSPAGYPNLDLDDERRQLESIVFWRRNIDVTFLAKAGRLELREALLGARDDPFHVLHFMGHGTFLTDSGEGVLLFEGKEGAEEVTGQELADEIKDFPSLRFVFLNACQTGRTAAHLGFDPFGGVASALVLAGIPAVVAMRLPISDGAAITFGKSFYKRLASGDPMDVAMAEGRLAIRRKEETKGEWGIPLLFLRGPVEPLFQIGPDTGLRRRIAAGAVGAMLFTMAAMALPFGLRSQPIASQVSPTVVAEALKLSNQGVALIDQRKLSEARSAFAAALRADPGFAPAHANLADLDASQGHYADALGHARAAVRAAPKTATYEYNLGTILSHMGRNEEALERLGRATELDPCYAKAFNEKGNVYLDLDLPSDARREIERGLQFDPDFAPLHKNLARVDLAQGRKEEAIRHLEEALPLYDPRDARGSAEALYWLAVANSQAGHGETACATLEQLQAQGIAALPWKRDARGLAQQAGCEGVFKQR